MTWHADRRGGFVLVTVLWAVVVLAAVGVEIYRAAAADRLAAAAARDAARDRWSARAGLARALAALDRQLDTSATVGGARTAGDTLLALRFTNDALVVQAAAIDTRARLNVNVATEAQLRALATALGFGAVAADSLAAAVLDWRDADRSPRALGAEGEWYAERGADVPPNGPLASVEELRGVRGVSEGAPVDAFARFAAFVMTVGDGLVNPNAAPVAVLATIPTLDEADAAALVRARTRTPFRTIYDVLAALPPATARRLRADVPGFAATVALTPRDVELVVDAGRPGHEPGATIRAHVVLLGGARRALRSVVER